MVELLPFAGAFKNGDAERLPPLSFLLFPVLFIGGVAVREGGLLGFSILGLSQEEKKSLSTDSPKGVLVPLVEDSGISVMTTSSGNLYDCQGDTAWENNIDISVTRTVLCPLPPFEPALPYTSLPRLKYI